MSRFSGKAIYAEGKQLAQGFDHVVVDAGGCDSTGLRSALLLAQRAIIPVGASQLDAAALTDVRHIVDLARDFNPDLHVRVLLTRVDPRTKDAADMLAFLQEQELTALPSMICERGGGTPLRWTPCQGQFFPEFKLAHPPRSQR